MKRLQSVHFNTQRGFSLIEVVIAIGICSFCMIAMLGLLPVALKSVQTTTQQTAAATILKSISMDLRSTVSGSNLSPSLGIPLPAWNTQNVATNKTLYFDENGTLYSSSSSANVRYAATLMLSNSNVFVTIAQIRVYWPASAATTNALGAVETVASIPRM